MQRSRIIRNTILLSIMLLPGCGAASIPSTARAAEPAAAPAKQEKDTIYALHHMIIPGILFSDTGSRFFNDLYTGNSAEFRRIVEEPLGKAYSAGLKIKAEHHPDFDLVLISFPEPVTEPLCRHAALVRKGDTYRYITLEEGNDIARNGCKTFLCEWAADNTRKSYGPRKYDTLNEFKAELITFLKQ
jgi:hypothetical protein